MCQLLGMNTAEPTDFKFSISGFIRRGGISDKHVDGFGLAMYKKKGDLETFFDDNPACVSPIAFRLTQSPMKTFNMISHIRLATSGEKNLKNVHPFQRELWGIQFCFAHNGDVPRFSRENILDIPTIGKARKGNKKYHPVGTTDSEAIFCSILNALEAEFPSLPTLTLLFDAIQRLCAEIISNDNTVILNFLLGCGEHTQFAFSFPGARAGSKVWNGLHYTIRDYPFTTLELADVEDCSFDFSKTNGCSDKIAILATKPLTKNENWIEMQRNQLIMFHKGVPNFNALDCSKTEKEGKGLSSSILPP